MIEMVVALLMIVNGEIKEHRIQENQNHLLLNIEKNKGNTIVTNDKLERMEEKLNQMEMDFKHFLIQKSK